MTSSSPSDKNDWISKKQTCLLEILKGFETLHEKENSHWNCVTTLCQWYDRLLSVLNDDGDDNKRRGDGYLLCRRMSTSRENDNDDGVLHAQTLQFLQIEADLYRALIIICLCLLEKLPAGNTTNSAMMDTTKTQLQTTIRQSNALIKILKNLHAKNYDDDHSPLATKYPILNTLMAQKKFSYEYEEESNAILLDKDQLEMEEDELLRMASTPVPNEQPQHHASMETNNHPMETQSSSSCLVARMSMEQEDTSTTTVQVTLDDRGVLRTRQSAKHEGAWWVITTASTISYESPIFTITSVVTNFPKFSSTTLTLDVGRDAPIWWETIAKLTHSLKETKELQEELKELWPQEEFQAVLHKNVYCVEQTTMLN